MTQAPDQKSPTIIPVILCGGSGTRLWPASRESRPKQFLSLMNEDSLLQNTVRRALAITNAPASSVMVVTLGAMKNDIAAQIGDASAHILCEPSARNTAAAVAFAADYAAKTFGDDAILWILPSDHHIGNESALDDSFQYALQSAKDGHLVTFGIAPTRPDTGYGYIRAGKAKDGSHILPVEQFVEKPDLETAKKYLASGQYLWNSGMFLFTAKNVLAEFSQHAPQILSGVRAAVKTNACEPDAQSYAAIESRPFDKAIMEHSNRVTVVPSNPGWSDIGSWESLWDLREKDENNNVLLGNAITHNAKNSLVQAHGKLIAVAGLDNIVVVETDDAILIMDKTDNDSMKELVKKLQTTIPTEFKK